MWGWWWVRGVFRPIFPAQNIKKRKFFFCLRFKSFYFTFLFRQSVECYVKEFQFWCIIFDEIKIIDKKSFFVFIFFAFQEIRCSFFDADRIVFGTESLDCKCRSCRTSMRFYGRWTYVLWDCSFQWRPGNQKKVRKWRQNFIKWRKWIKLFDSFRKWSQIFGNLKKNSKKYRKSRKYKN